MVKMVNYQHHRIPVLTLVEVVEDVQPDAGVVLFAELAVEHAGLCVKIGVVN